MIRLLTHARIGRPHTHDAPIRVTTTDSEVSNFVLVGSPPAGLALCTQVPDQVRVGGHHAGVDMRWSGASVSREGEYPNHGTAAITDRHRSRQPGSTEWRDLRSDISPSKG